MMKNTVYHLRARLREKIIMESDKIKLEMKFVPTCDNFPLLLLIWDIFEHNSP